VVCDEWRLLFGDDHDSVRHWDVTLRMAITSKFLCCPSQSDMQLLRHNVRSSATHALRYRLEAQCGFVVRHDEARGSGQIKIDDVIVEVRHKQLQIPSFPPLDQAEKLYVNELRMRENVVGPDSPGLLGTLKGLVELYSLWSELNPEVSFRKAEKYMVMHPLLWLLNLL
jgi:hypothetical protein